MGDEELNPDHVREAQVRQESDELLAALDRLRRAEAVKRGIPFASPEFQQRAREVEEEARRVFRLATRQQVHGEDAAQAPEMTGEAAEGWPANEGEGAETPDLSLDE